MSPQSSIAHYRIVSKLGEGGMDSVYLTTGTKLNRDVAIKVFREVFAADRDRIPIGHARSFKAAKRDVAQVLPIPEAAPGSEILDILAVHEAVDRMATCYPRGAQVVGGFFGGLEFPEIAPSLEFSQASVERQWRFARAWLQSKMAS